MVRIVLAGLIASGLSSAGVEIVHAQSYPIRPIKLILPYTPGSPNDVIARLSMIAFISLKVMWQKQRTSTFSHHRRVKRLRSIRSAN